MLTIPAPQARTAAVLMSSNALPESMQNSKVEPFAILFQARRFYLNDGIRPPSRLLLATDLCARCDRPLDRAKQLALEWQSELVILTVREGPRTPDEVGAWLDRDSAIPALELAARRELQEEFAGSGLAPTLQVAEGEVVAAILDAAGTLGDGVVVTGASGEEGFQELIFGSTAERLAQGLSLIHI